jgi:hypothetical protein
MPRNLVCYFVSYGIQGLIPVWHRVQNPHISRVRKTHQQSQTIIKEYPTGVCEPVCMITSHIITPEHAANSAKPFLGHSCKPSKPIMRGYIA